jgi:hypothetical protein
MSMQKAVVDINGAVTAAVGAAATAFDALVDELKKDPADAGVVLDLSAQIWTSSLKAWANLVLAPAKLAAAITSGGD